MNNIYNNENIVERARKEIQRGSLVNDIPHFDQLLLSYTSHDDISAITANEIKWLQASSNIPSYRKLHSRRGFIGSVILLFKKTIRKIIKIYIEPIASDQSEYNRHITKVLEIMQESLDRKDIEIKELQEVLNKQIVRDYRG